MTAETDLLPLPDTYSAAEVAMRNDGKWVRREDFDWHLAARGKIARANLAELQREVATWKGLHASEVQVRQRWQARADALRGEVEGLKRDRESVLQAHTFARERAERLAEALRGIETKLVHSMDHARSSLERKRAMSECADAARAALEQEGEDE